MRSDTGGFNTCIYSCSNTGRATRMKVCNKSRCPSLCPGCAGLSLLRGGVKGHLQAAPMGGGWQASLSFPEILSLCPSPKLAFPAVHQVPSCAVFSSSPGAPQFPQVPFTPRLLLLLGADCSWPFLSVTSSSVSFSCFHFRPCAFSSEVPGSSSHSAFSAGPWAQCGLFLLGLLGCTAQPSSGCPLSLAFLWCPPRPEAP